MTNPTFMQTLVILILGQADASVVHVIQEIVTSLSQNRPAAFQPSPPGQSVVRWIRRGHISVVTSCQHRPRPSQCQEKPTRFTPLNHLLRQPHSQAKLLKSVCPWTLRRGALCVSEVSATLGRETNTSESTCRSGCSVPFWVVRGVAIVSILWPRTGQRNTQISVKLRGRSTAKYIIRTHSCSRSSVES